MFGGHGALTKQITAFLLLWSTTHSVVGSDCTQRVTRCCCLGWRQLEKEGSEGDHRHQWSGVKKTCRRSLGVLSVLSVWLVGGEIAKK